MTQVTRLPGLPIWALFLLVVLTGAVGALAHAPFDISTAVLAPLMAGYFTLRRVMQTGRAFVLGLALGAGYFGATMTWITEPFQVDASNTGWMAPFALVLLALGMGLFWGAALAFARWAGGQPWVLVVAWTGAELLRAYLLTGFPWATPPQALVDTLLGQGLAWQRGAIPGRPVGGQGRRAGPVSNDPLPARRAGAESDSPALRPPAVG